MSAIVEEKSLSIRAHKLNLEKERKSLAQKARSRHLETLKRIEDRITAEKNEECREEASHSRGSPGASPAGCSKEGGFEEPQDQGG
ncbi:Gammatubulin complex component 6like [Caligus rogercresseyi]|uniref:Gammatubulin complex component 6like n=1 Tax=Caligus rogercresseyi TaxID=217165 RepID=A0A7T8GV23_CALRO|nr:Gammatubulin complex component 6like [Caligus rogercresseyi]